MIVACFFGINRETCLCFQSLEVINVYLFYVSYCYILFCFLSFFFIVFFFFPLCFFVSFLSIMGIKCNSSLAII